jgi:taurine dioxygenase
MYKIKLLSGSIGAEVHGIDLSQFIIPSIANEIRNLWLKHQVIFFRDQNISAGQHRSLAHIFGSLQTHPAYKTVPGFPEITILEATADKPYKIDTWHTDMTFRMRPPLGTVLRSRIIPEKGGDTLFASLSAAYESLSGAMKVYLSGLSAMHDFSYGFKESLAEPGGRERLAKAVADNPPVAHKIVKTHPETGKKLLYVNKLFTTHIVGLRLSESDAILSFLYDHITTDEYTCRFQWKPHSIAIWDNRATQHKPINDFYPSHRLMERIVIDG